MSSLKQWITTEMVLYVNSVCILECHSKISFWDEIFSFFYIYMKYGTTLVREKQGNFINAFYIMQTFPGGGNMYVDLRKICAPV